MILGRHFFVTPSDSLAVLAANATLRAGLRRAAWRAWRARCPPARRSTAWPRRWASPATRHPPAGSSSATCSMPAWSRCAARRAAGTGSDHVREKDGLWAVLFWLNILAVRGELGGADRARALAALRPQRLFAPRLRRRGRCSRRAARWTTCATRCPTCRARLGGRTVPRPTTSPTPTRSTARSARGQGVRIVFDDGSRIVFRLSGTGTEGATLRVYLERFEPDAAGTASRRRRRWRR